MDARITITVNGRSASMFLPTNTYDGSVLSDETILALARVACTDLFYIARGDLERDAEALEYVSYGKKE